MPLHLHAPPTPPHPAGRYSLADLSPGNFGMVMATGIVAIAMLWLGWPRLAQVLGVIAALMYAALALLSVLRLILYPARVLADVGEHLRGPAHFSLVAASAVLGSQCLLLWQRPDAALALWGVAAVLWLLLMYGIVATLSIKALKPPLDHGIDGTWLLAVVATQSVAVLAVMLAPQMGARHAAALHLLGLSLWLAGGMLYIWIMGLIFYRYLFFPLAPEDLTPPYWINMGAMAISTLAGSLLIHNAAQDTLLAALLPFTKGFTLFFWASGSWWIPLLIVLSVWRYAVMRVAPRYDPMAWSAVFPLGMYAVCTLDLIRALDLPLLNWLPPLFGAAALVAWALTFAGLLHRIGHWLRVRR